MPLAWNSGLVGKGLFGAAAVGTISTTAVVGKNSRDNYPLTETWLSENGYSPRENGNYAKFSKDTSNEFSLGCHSLIFEGKGVKQLYEGTDIDSDNTSPSITRQTQLPNPFSFKDSKEPILGCSTAYRKNSSGKYIHEYELVVRQGDRGVSERISVHTDKVISQAVFYEKGEGNAGFKHVFGLYKYIKQQHEDTRQNNKKMYKWANPNPGQDNHIWNDIELSNEGDKLYYAVWVEGSKGDDFFKNIGIKVKDGIFSSLYKEATPHEKASDFIYVNKEDSGELKKTKLTESPQHYDLTALSDFQKQLSSKKGRWREIDEFCGSLVNKSTRLHIKEVKQVAQYCYELKKVTS